MSSLSLHNPESGAACDIELGQGATVAIEAATPAGLDALLEQVLQQVPQSQVAHGVGGMVSNINVLENIALPAIYHGLARSREFDARVLEGFAACGLDGEQAEELCRQRPGDLGPFDKRLCGFVRCLLMHPEVLVYSRFFEGLTVPDTKRAMALDGVYHHRHPQGTSIYLVLSNMPEQLPGCDRRHVT
jgi:ABC-type transporter Mla maintaining outer membrane lipid asymmetry ATPase subunit MlaF